MTDSNQDIKFGEPPSWECVQKTFTLAGMGFWRMIRAADGTVVFDPHETLLAALGAKRNLGLNRSFEKFVTDFFFPEGAQMALEEMDACFSGERESFNIELQIRFLGYGGAEIWLNIIGNVDQRDSEGRVMSLGGFAQNISERHIAKKRLETALREKNETDERNRILLDALPFVCNFWVIRPRDFVTDDKMFLPIPSLPDKLGYLVHTNKAGTTLFDLPDKQSYIDAYYLLSPEFQPNGSVSLGAAIAMLDKSIHEGSVTFEWLHQKLDGTPIPCEITLTKVPYGDSNVVCATIRDLRELKAAQSATIREQMLLQGIMDTSPLCFAITVNDTIKFITPFAEQFTGRTIGDNISEIYTDVSAYHMLRTRQNKNEKISEYAVSIRRADGEASEMLLDSFNTNYYGEVGVMNWFIDITKMHQKNHELSLAKKLAEESTKAKSNFLANMSHEIRTPMNGIMGMTYLALKTSLSPKQKDYLEKIQTATNSLLHIVNDILDFSKIEAGHVEIEELPFRLDDILSHLSDQAALKAHEKKLELVFVTDPATTTLYVGDPLRLGQVLLNLVSNAVKFTEKGQITLSIRTGEQRDGRTQIFFSVRDTGIGIEQAQQASLFQPFSQVDVSTTRKYGGTGLGLSISRHLVEIMGGVIEMESSLGKGSVFSFDLWLPTAKEDAPQRRKASLTMLKDLKVLLVEDNVTSRQVLIEYVESFSMKPEAFGSAEEALERLSRGAYDLIFLDWKLPGMNGIELARKIRENTQNSQSKILLITAFSEDLLEKERAILDGVLFKPFTISDLMNSTLEALHLSPQGRGDSRERLFEEKELSSLAGAHILLTEDNELNRQLAEELLTGAGARVTTAMNGKEALVKVREFSFDLVLIDLQMPEMDGYEATREIRNIPGREKLPIIAMTASAMVGDRETAIQAGMNDHVPKPVNPGLLFATILRWLPRSFQEKQKEEQKEEPKVPRSEKTMSLPELPGIDSVSGLVRIGNNAELYLQLLIKFREKYTRTAENIRAAIERGDLEEAKMETHTIRGVSGNLSMNVIFEAVGYLDGLLHRSSEKSLLLEAWQPFKEAMDSTLEGLQSLLLPGKESKKLSQGKPEDLLRLLYRLKPDVANLTPKRCAPIMTEMEASIWPEANASKISLILQKIRAYLLEEALTEIEEQIQILEEANDA